MVRPGDKVQVVGIYRAKTNKISKGSNMFNKFFSTYVDVLSFSLL